MPGAGLMILPGNQEQNGSGISGGVTDVRTGPYLPAASDSACHLRGVVVTNCGKSDHHDFCAGGGLQSANQVVGSLRRGSIDDQGEVIDIADGLIRNQ